MHERPVDEADVAALARAAGLPLSADRLPLVAAQLTGWLEAAGELNTKMAAAEHQTVTPITVFTNPGTTDTAEHLR
jgi:hypothetical protein